MSFELEREVEANETDPGFPSGPWSGYYLQWGSRHPQGLELRFRRGRMTGSGRDGLGGFTIVGSYDLETRVVSWSKRYLGSHEIDYRGYQDGKGIWGSWTLPGQRDGFHIWPGSHGLAQGRALKEEKERPIRILQVGPRPSEGDRES